MKKFIFTVIITIHSFGFAQFSKTHYIPPISFSPNQQVEVQALYISCPSTTPVAFRITQLGTTPVFGTVSRDNPYIYDTSVNQNLTANGSEISVISNNKGYIVEADDLIYVTVRVIGGGGYQAGGLVSKGLAALGTKYRIGAFINTGLPNYTAVHHTFAAILATENNTTITFGDIKPGVSLVNNDAAGNTPARIVLNRGQSYVYAVQGPNPANKDGLIGSSITSDKPIAVNCGSIAGSNGTNAGNLDYGFDQIVSAERTGKEYIFVKGNGVDVTERPLIVANINNTDVFVNGSPTPIATLAAGQYLALSGTDYGSSTNLYIRTSENVFAYQGIGGTTSQANQNMTFLPPLSCETPKVINNIPFIGQVGNNNGFTGTVCLVTEVGATLNFIIDGTNYTAANLPNPLAGPFEVTGNPNFVTYRITGLSGNVSVFSSKQVYLSYFGSSGAATYGGYYSGFTFKPEVSFAPINLTSSNCIPNVKLAVNSLSSFDTFQWFQDGAIIALATNNQFTPLVPGFYSVEAKISQCGITLLSDKIPVSSCAGDIDNDGANDNVDLDNDNDGITNCAESFGNIKVDLSVVGGTIAVDTYLNPYTTAVSTTIAVVPMPFTGAADGSFVTEVIAGKNNLVTKTVNFESPISIVLEYPATASASDLLNNNGEYMLQVPINNTITVLNPNDQLLIDTNYDGIFESGITSFSSFQIRFRLNSSTGKLDAGTGTFKFFSNLIKSVEFTHKNLDDNANNKATFKITATCLPKDSDGDGVADQNDCDSENDGIPDIIENLGASYAIIAFIDANKNGINDSYENLVGLDSDSDGFLNYLDLDSDNDGIYDLIESGSNATDANNNGVLDGTLAAFGANGLLNALETAPDSNILTYNVANSNTTTFQNFIDLDSDGDGCNDVFEVAYTDSDSNGILGTSPVVTNANGLVTGNGGYTVLTALQQSNYTTNSPIIINTQPADTSGCETGNTIFSISTNAVTSYQWKVSTNGGATFTNVANVAPYSGANTNSLLITNVPTSMNGFKYQVFLTKNGNACNLMSTIATFAVLTKPVVTSQVTIVQCDTDLDLVADFNLNAKNNVISAQSASQTFTYFTTQAGAITDNAAVKIDNPTAYNSLTGNTVWARIVNNSNGCFNVSKINLVVSATQLPAGFSRAFTVCDDFVNATANDYDGISKFNFSTVENDVIATLPTPTGFSISYYPSFADFSAETNPISKNIADPISIYNYRNVVQNAQTVYIRVESTLTNDCFGDGKIVLNVEALPVAHQVSVTRQCDDNPNDAVVQHAFDTSAVLAGVLNGQSISNVNVSYFDSSNNQISSSTPNNLPNPFTTQTQLIRVRLTNRNGSDPAGRCFDETSIQFTVDKKPIANPVVIAPECDLIFDDNVVKYSFNTTNINATLLGTQNANDFVITYFAADGSALTPLPNPFFTATQQIKAVLTNPLNTTCPAETFIQFTVNELPVIKPYDEDYFCDGTTNTKIIDAGLSTGNINDYNYQWFKNGVILPGETNYTYIVTASGIYSTDIKNKITGCFRTRTYKVIFSEKAKITNVVITDLNDDNNTVVVTTTGAGSYEYSIDEPQGPFQSSGVFTNITSGLHMIYVNDKNGCEIASQEIAVVGIMKFFTPNGDSFNDFWKIKGVTSVYNQKSEVFIFDRFGKLMKHLLNGDDQGWDGKVLGHDVPADDYWFTLVLEDGRTLKGHFSLKR
ncbi:MAG: hypothetical protein RLZZ312_1460 [Bacteroidota bacterium]